MAGVERSPRVPQIFSQAVSTVMKDWQALNIAVDNMFGGPMSKEKASWLEEVTVDFMCNNADVQSWELEDYLSVLMDQEFHTSVEDASIPTVSKKICDLYDQYRRGNIQLIQEFIAKSQSQSLVVAPVQCKEEEEEIDGLDIVEEEEERAEEEREEEEREEEEREEEEEKEASTSSVIEVVQEEIHQLQLTNKEERQSEVNDEEGWEVVRKNRRKSKQ